MPLEFDGHHLGGGGQRVFSCLAVEYILGQAGHDTFVREREPGNGSMFYQAGEHLVGPLNSSSRVLSHWCFHPDPRLGSGSQAIELAAPPSKGLIISHSQGKLSYPENSLALWRRTLLGARPERLVVVGPGVLSPRFLAPGQVAADGLRCHLSVELPLKPEGPSILIAVRHGIMLESVEVDLGMPGAVAIVASPNLKTDATTLGLVRDQALDDIVELARERLDALADRVLALRDRVGERRLGWLARARL
ncbi:MAG: hypothetical protein AB7S38_28250 [Vulcanimicrobiota bacterium]